MFLASGNTGYNSVADVVVVFRLIFPFWLKLCETTEIEFAST